MRISTIHRLPRPRGRRGALGAALAAAALSAPPIRAGETTALFNVDPSWDGRLNRSAPTNPPIVTQNFGFSPTNNAGGSAGELGGLVSRSTTPASYAVPIATKTLNDTLTASGRLMAPAGQNTGGAFHFGWFNSERQGWRPWNALGFRLNGDGTFAEVLLDVMTQNWKAAGLNATNLPQPISVPFDGAQHTWSMSYNPGGNGTISFTLDGTTATLAVPAGIKSDGAVFNRFGLFNQQTPSGAIRVYLDNIVYNGTTQNFDNVNNGWQEIGTRTTFPDPEQRAAYNFGYSNTNRAGGAGSGEIGGLFWRAVPHQEPYYAAPVQNLSLQTPMHAQGKVAMTRAASDGGMMFGWFNKNSIENTTDTGPGAAKAANWMGVIVEGPSAVGWYFRPAYSASTGNYRDSLNGPQIYPNGQSLDWSIDYSPGANNGNGAMVVTLNGVSRVFNLTDGDKALGASFDHFGLFNLSPDGSYVELFFDDITYTSSPTPQWVSAGGNWNGGGNWVGGIPNGVGAVASFLGVIDISRTVFTDAAVTAGTVRFDNLNTYHLAGLGSLTLQVGSGSALVDVVKGTHKINLPLTIASNTTLNVASGAILKISDPVIVNANTSLTQAGGGTVLYESTISALSGASITFGSSTHAASLTLASAARGTIAAHGANPVRVLQVDQLSLASDARLDLADNAAAVNYTGGSPIASLRDQLRTAFNNGPWNGNGITSSIAAADSTRRIGIAIAEASSLGLSSFLGQSVDTTTVLMRETYFGDANLDGMVNTMDFTRLAADFNVSGKFWHEGDFNYDGTVNALDFNAIAGNFGQALASASLASLVPEPACAASVAALISIQHGYRSRRRR